MSSAVLSVKTAKKLFVYTIFHTLGYPSARVRCNHVIVAVRLRSYGIGLKEAWVTSPRKLEVLQSEAAGMAWLLRYLAVNPSRQVETCFTGPDSKDKAFQHVCMLAVNFSAGRPCDLGRNLAVLESLRVGDKVVSKTVYRCRVHVQEAEAGQTDLGRHFAEYWLGLFLVFSTWRDDFGTRTKGKLKTIKINNYHKYLTLIIIVNICKA